MPAPKGTGLAVGRNVRSVFVLAGIQNVWSKGKGRTSIKLNFVRAAVDALKRVSELKMTKDLERKLKK
jgi:ribosomal protein S5